MLRFLKTQSINTLKTIEKIVNKINYICNAHSIRPLHIPFHAIAGVFHIHPTPRPAPIAIGGKTVSLYQNLRNPGHLNMHPFSLTLQQTNNTTYYERHHLVCTR
jgi:hypothetical protein